MSESIIDREDLVLITGSNGFIGARVVENLLSRGFRNLRCFVRPSSHLDHLRRIISEASADSAVEIVAGDLVTRDDCLRAARDVRVIYHLANNTADKSFAGSFMSAALATRNLIDAFLEVGAQQVRFVNVSSFAVYSNRSLSRHAPLTETCELEDSPQDRYDPYCFGKLKQDELVEDYGRKRGLPYVTLRPGAVFGPGRTTLSGRVGVGTFGVFLHTGGGNRLPLTYVENCADAITLGGIVPGIDGEIFNIVDDDLPTSRKFLRAYKRRAGWFPSIPVPYPLAFGLSWLWESYAKVSKGQLPPAFNRRRCMAEWKGNQYPNDKLRERLGWQPRIDMEEATNRFLGQFSQEAVS